MRTYQFNIFGKLKEGIFCRIIFRIDDNDQEIFVKAISKTILSSPKTLSQIEAAKFITDNKLKLIDEFKTAI